MSLDALWRHHRAKSIAAAIAVHVVLGYVLLAGLGGDAVRQAADSLTVLTIAQPQPPPPPPPPPPIQPKPDAKKEGAAAPPNIASRATAVAAPEPIVRLPIPPPPIATSTQPLDGADSTTGASDVIGPGTGAGGMGNGTGSGDGGDGTGSGGLPPVGARMIGGRITPRDYPPSAARARVEGIVGANVYIGRDGRVTRCVVKITSGDAALDDTTCRLIVQRFRYEPARGSDGRPVPDIVGWEQTWWLGRR